MEHRGEREALMTARAIEDPFHRARALAALVPRLPETSLDEAQQALQEIETPDRDWWTAQQLPWPEAVAAARGGGLAALVARLSDLGCPQQALEVAQTIEPLRWRVEALAQLAPHLPAAAREETMLGALAAVRRAIERGKGRGDWSEWGALGYHVPPDVAAEITAQGEAISDASDPVAALLALAPQLPQSSQAEALVAAREAENAMQASRERNNAPADGQKDESMTELGRGT